jgi:hypothetical protein
MSTTGVTVILGQIGRRRVDTRSPAIVGAPSPRTGIGVTALTRVVRTVTYGGHGPESVYPLPAP